MVFILACTLLLILQPTRALPLNVSSSDPSTGTRHDTETVPVLCLLVFLLFLCIVCPVLAITMDHHAVALQITVYLSSRASKSNIPSLPHDTAQPFPNVPCDTVAIFELSAIPGSSPLPTESAPSVVVSAGDEHQSVDLSTLASFYTASQHSLAPFNSSTIQSPSVSSVDSVPFIVLSGATGDEHQSIDLSTLGSTSFYSSSEHSLTPSNTSTIHFPSHSSSGSWVSDVATFVQRPLASLRR